MSTELTLHSRRMVVKKTIQVGLGGSLAWAAGVILDRADVNARRKRRGGRTRKSIDTSTSTTSTNNQSNVSVAIGEPGAPGPSVEIDS